MEKLFPVIETHEDVTRLARGGGIAGLAFLVLILLDGLLAGVPGSLAGMGGHFSAAAEAFPVIGSGLEIAAILFMTWRIWSGKGYISAVLLAGLFVAETVTAIHGPYGLAWLAAYFALGLMMLNAIRACLRHSAVSPTAV